MFRGRAAPAALVLLLGVITISVGPADPASAGPPDPVITVAGTAEPAVVVAPLAARLRS
jgi:hypothetical protein